MPTPAVLQDSHPPATITWQRRASRRSLLRTAIGCVATALLAAAGTPAAMAAATQTPRAAIVFGGSGQLGAEIVRELVAAGHDVTVFLRPSSSQERIAGLPVKRVEGDVLVEADVERALKARRYDLVIDALGRSESDVTFFATSGVNIAKWAKATGVGQLVLHSSVGVGSSKPAYPPQRYEAMSRLFAAKKAGEDAFIATGIGYTIIRNAVLRDLPAGAEDRARLYDDPLKFGTVSRRGLGRLTRECVDNPACRNKIFTAVDETMERVR
jgi:uncharacterized protein YbjT (DUF2867 family)